jgi:hypothetical protein
MHEHTVRHARPHQHAPCDLPASISNASCRVQPPRSAIQEKGALQVSGGGGGWGGRRRKLPATSVQVQAGAADGPLAATRAMHLIGRSGEPASRQATTGWSDS